MTGQYLIVKSITYAYKAVNLLGDHNIWATIDRAPASISSCGCNYAVKIRNSTNLEYAKNIIENGNVEVLSYGVA